MSWRLLFYAMIFHVACFFFIFHWVYQFTKAHFLVKLMRFISKRLTFFFSRQKKNIFFSVRFHLIVGLKCLFVASLYVIFSVFNWNEPIAIDFILNHNKNDGKKKKNYELIYVYLQIHFLPCAFQSFVMGI